jgi:hypothetical protein
MTRIEFESTLNDIASINLSSLGEIDSSMANSKVTFYIKDGRYRFKIESGTLSFDCGIGMPDTEPGEELSEDYIERFCNTVEEIRGYAQSAECIADMAAKGEAMSEEDDREFMLQVYLFRILLASILDMLESTVAERCL